MCVYGSLRAHNWTGTHESLGSTCLRCQKLQRPDIVEDSVPATGEGATRVHMPGLSATEETRLHAYSVWMHMLTCVQSPARTKFDYSEQGKMLESQVLNGCKSESAAGETRRSERGATGKTVTSGDLLLAR